jgi:hypothetical protein
MTLVEALVAVSAATVVLVGAFTAYVWATRTFAQSGSRAALQRQGTMVVEELGRRVRSGEGTNALTLGCQGQSNAIQVVTASGAICYYAGGDGELCADRGAGCRNLLAGAFLQRTPLVEPVRLLTQSAPPEPLCPEVVAPGLPCFAVTVNDPAAPTQVNVAFALSDGMHGMSFDVSLTCSGRNCRREPPL